MCNIPYLFISSLKTIYSQESILYGGSVTPDSVEALVRSPDIDGALVGGASLDARAFAKIANTVNEVFLTKGL